MSVENKKYTFDKLQMYFGEDYTIKDATGNPSIIIHQPKIWDIVTFGEKMFYDVLNIFITNPTVYRVPLWKAGIDWTKTSDYELFLRLFLQSNLTLDMSRLIFGELDFTEFNLYKRQNEVDGSMVEDVVLVNQKQQVLIDEDVYTHIACYLRTMFNIFPKVEKAKGRTTKEWMIEEDIQKAKEQKPQESMLLPMISFCLNHPGFKYKKEELKNMGIVEFNDSVQRLLVYESTNALMKGIYSGFVDASKISKQEFNFMREINS
jgi:hypothetical protein